MQDVAHRAGVSLATVSRVVNETDYPVSESVRNRVLTAVEELNYVPNIQAQQLRTRSNNVIGLIVRDIADSYFGELARAVTERALELGFLSFVCNTGREPRNELRYHELLWQHRVRGIILAGGGMSTVAYRQMLERQAQRFKDHGMRIIALAPQGVEIRSVSVNYVEVAEMITHYVIARAHRSIALITGREDVVTCAEHLQGYKNALKEGGLPFREDLVVYSDFTEASGYKSMMELLSRNLSFSAVFCGSDTIAIGALQALSHKNRHVPRDVSVLSIGDLPQAQYTTPPLTTVRIPRRQMAEHAVNAIIGEAEEEGEGDFLFHPELIERSSVLDLRNR